MKNKEMTQRLWELQDETYKVFQCKLMPGVPQDTVIGVRIPELRRLAKQLYKEGTYDAFLRDLPHKYYDEMNLHGLLISEMTEYSSVIHALDQFLPHINNWATCDLMNPKKAFNNQQDKLEKDIVRWMHSRDTYTIRFGMLMLMRYFMDDHFDTKYLDWVVQVQSEEYYVNMMRAWFFATALTKQYEATVPYIEERRLDEWTHKKSIQKAIESRQVSDERKMYLRGLKRKN